jgi:hypothetical protein
LAAAGEGAECVFVETSRGWVVKVEVCSSKRSERGQRGEGVCSLHFEGKVLSGGPTDYKSTVLL